MENKSTKEVLDPICAFNTSLAKAQAKYKKAAKNGRGQVRQGKISEFSTYEDLKDATTSALTSEGFSVNHSIKNIDGILWNITYLKHSSGHVEESYWPLPNTTDDQKVGGTTTYSSRYCYRGLTGVACDDDDDDGESSAKQYNSNDKPVYKKVPEQQATPPNLDDRPNSVIRKTLTYGSGESITKEQIEVLENALDGYPEIQKEMMKSLDIKSFGEIKKERFPSIITRIQQIKDNKTE